VPSEYSSGSSRVQGSITKTGNTHLRRLLVESAWHHRARYAPGKTMRDRWELATPAARARGDAGNRRLNARWDAFRARRKRHVVANVAIARELAGWCWSLAVTRDDHRQPLLKSYERRQRSLGRHQTTRDGALARRCGAQGVGTDAGISSGSVSPSPQDCGICGSSLARLDESRPLAP